jgi:hypothetical protein
VWREGKKGAEGGGGACFMVFLSAASGLHGLRLYI